MGTGSGRAGGLVIQTRRRRRGNVMEHKKRIIVYVHSHDAENCDDIQRGLFVTLSHISH